MSIKTEQLRHSIHELDDSIKRLASWDHPLTDPSSQHYVEEILDQTLDCLTIIYHILLEAK